jgi:myo-inositol catabolism protein IolC
VEPEDTQESEARQLTSTPILVILAFDHRRSVERDLYSMTSPNSEIAARIAADKLLVYEALLDAVPQLPTGVQAGILIDEEYGASVAEWTGFAIGRSIWWDPLDAHLHHRATTNEARRRIRDTYLDFAQYYVDARNGGLTTADKTELWG